MSEEGTIIIPIIGYIIGFLAPIIGVIYGVALFFLKKDVPLYNKHGKYIIIFSIIIWIIFTILLFSGVIG